MDKSNSNMD